LNAVLAGGQRGRGARHAADRGADFTAVVAGNDLIALGCYDVFVERSINCPDGSRHRLRHPLMDKTRR
jgi:DNA-binding LacI/PurR family transcriptional regulator